ncbi:MAG: tetratricopeptide repeat protein, partial [Acidobacteriota bacterium]
PSSEERRRQESIRAKLAQAKALEAAADYPQAANLAQQALEEAEALEALPLIGEARYRLASGLGRQGQFAELRRNSLQAARIAMAARDDDLLARALTRMIIASWVRADTEDALEWSQLAAAAIERLGGRNDLEAIRRQFLCMLGYQSRQYETAADHCRAALEIDPGMPPQRRALVLNNLGNAQSGLGHLDAALATYRESMALDEQLYGREHPAYATTLGNIGNILGKRCELIEAQAHHEQALAIKERTEGPDNPNIVVQLLNVGLLLADRGLYPEGVPYLERALRFEPDDPHLLADIQFHLARALWGSGGDRQRALRLAGTALEAFESLGEVYARETAEATDWLAERRGS